MKYAIRPATLLALSALAACSTPPVATPDAGEDSGRPDSASADVIGDGSNTSDADASADAVADAGSCSRATCSAPGAACVGGACVEDCRRADAVACAGETVCDFVDGRCRAANSCTISGAFTSCGEETLCGPGSECSTAGMCVGDGRCQAATCDGSRCYGVDCGCARPAARCAPVSLEQLNAPEFVGAIPTNMRPDEGLIDLEFDDVCTAYAVTVISGQDHLRQITSDGAFRSWGGASNLDMGEVAIRRSANATFSANIGEVALTYACIAGCTATTEDAQQGVVKLDRTSAMRPLPNVVPAMVTRGTGPFGNATIDAGPAGLAYGADNRLYIGNLDANGEFFRVELSTRTRTLLHRFASRVHASAIFDSTNVLVALEDRTLYLLNTAAMGAAPVRFATLEAPATSLARDRFTGRVYAEMSVAGQPRIVEISADGARITEFQRPRRLGRIAIAPDHFLYHTAVYPNVQWTNAMAPPIERWPLPATR